MVEPATGTYRGVPAAQRRAERRQRLLDAALDLFTDRGYNSTRIEQLCARAGVSTRNFYEEFANKEAVLLALHELSNAAALAEATAALHAVPDNDLLVRIDTLLAAFLRSITADPRQPRLNYVEAVGTSPAMEQQHREWVARWTRLIEDEVGGAADRGLAPARDYHLTAIALVGATTELLRDWQAQPEPGPVADIIAEVRRIAVAAITVA
ncbi:helix-turn-helix transcriptional regulator [Solihabitans fulvus]|uniref:Helix-turn-helix transcriptional regulator n=1 Tax=Solihabitans fulvus TaxID=1892852 RepID=A0A5B2X1E3_9PSEU|nr:TetR/AcrR family transcriptional regulator [Solihabitans fulvus]KAA2256717.1 helix-turn-helix transcriptional regulator [Solihabitans fulvus]